MAWERGLVAYLHWCWNELSDGIRNDLWAAHNQVVRVELGFEDFASGGSLATDLVHAHCDYLPESRRKFLLWRIVDDLPATVLNPKKWRRVRPVLEIDAARHGQSLEAERRDRVAAAIPHALTGLGGRRPVPPVVPADTLRFPSEDATRTGLAVIIRRLFWEERPSALVALEELRETLEAPAFGMTAIDEADAVQALLERAHFTRRETEALRAMAAGAAKPADLVAMLGWTSVKARQVLHAIKQKRAPLASLLRTRP
jgi:plasmid stability protein